MAAVDSFYFSHSVCMGTNPKIRALRRRWGVEGYGYYCLVLEAIYASHSPSLSLKNEWMREALADALDTDTATLQDFLDDCARLGLFDRDKWTKEQIITSGRIVETFRYKEQKSEAGKRSVEARRAAKQP